MRIFKRLLLVIAVGALALVAFAAWRIGPRNILGMIRYDQRKEGSLRVGDTLPDVQLVALDGTHRVSLKEFVGEKPLVLVFGSYT